MTQRICYVFYVEYDADGEDGGDDVYKSEFRVVSPEYSAYWESAARLYVHRLMSEKFSFMRNPRIISMDIETIHGIMQDVI